MLSKREKIFSQKPHLNEKLKTKKKSPQGINTPSRKDKNNDKD